MGPLLPVPFHAALPALDPSLESATLRWGGHKLCWGWAVPVLGSGSGVDQLGKGTGFRGASAIGELEVVCSGYPEGVELEREPGGG